MPDKPLASTETEKRFEQVLAELLQGEERGEWPNLSQVFRESPELEALLREFFRNRDGFNRLAPQLATSPTQPEASSQQPELLPGSRFDSYELLEMVGRGGRGIVYRVNDLELNRPLAVKVLRPELRDEPDAVRRFLEEAQVIGQLQHPGIVPVHAIGQLPDGRPYFAMKLVQGRTFAELLAERPTPEHDLPRFLAIFQQVCQAVAYAHSRGVIHRDLKPANIMVGSFAEVQVMDWGLAKVLTANMTSGESQRGGSGELATEQSDTVRTLRTEATGLSSADGLVVGTFSYMSPEQAKGEVDQVDPRSDVFGLGAVLCEVLTGQPPYTGAPPSKLHLMAAAGDLADAFARLDGCGSDAELIALAKDCLAPKLECRPRDAGTVAAGLTTYRAGVEERLRQAEIEKAAAQARTESMQAKLKAERRSRRLTVGLAVAVFAVVVTLAVGGSWLQQQRAERQAEAARQAEALQQQVGIALGQAIRFRQGGHFEESRELLEQTQKRLGRDGPTDLREKLDQTLTDTKLAERLDNARQRAITRVAGGVALELNGVRNEQEIQREMESWGVGELTKILEDAGLGNVWKDAAEVAAARVRDSGLRTELVAALDDCASFSTFAQIQEWVLAVARKADPNPERDRLRQLSLLWNTEALDRLAKEVRVAELSPQLVATLGRRLIGQGRNAVPLLRDAHTHHPEDFWINYLLGVALHNEKQWDDAIGYYRAALALRPRAAIVQNTLGVALAAKGKLDEAIGVYKVAVRLNPNSALLHYNLGNVLRENGELDEAMSHYEETLRINPYPSNAYHAESHFNLGAALKAKGKLDEAIRHFESALRRDLKSALYCADCHNSLGLALYKEGKIDEAIRH